MSHANPKNELQERCQKLGVNIPEYVTTCVGMEEATNQPLWTSSVHIGQLDREYTLDSPHPGTKRNAEKAVAQLALDKLKEDDETRLFFC
jgi:dsRNA-specific ribonuclease